MQAIATSNNKYSWKQMILISLPALSLAAAYGLNSPAMFHFVLNRFINEGILEQGRLNSALGLLGITGLFVSACAQPLVGYLSDRTQSVLGRRYPYMLAGVGLLILTLLAEVYAWNLWGFALAVFLTYIALSAIQNPTFALIPDFVPRQQMGLASGLKTVLEIVGVMVAGIVGWAFLGEADRPDLAVYFLWGLVLLTVVLPIITVRDTKPAKPKRSVRERYVRRFTAGKNSVGTTYKLIRSMVRHIHRRQVFRWWLVHRFFLSASFGILGKFAITYLEDVFGFSDNEARALQGQLILMLSLIVFVTPIISGILSDRFSRRRIVIWAAISAALATLMISFTRDLTAVIVFMSITGISTTVLFGVGWALVSSTIPLRQAGFYMGITNIATSLGTMIAYSLGVVVDEVNARTNSSTQGYVVILVLASLFYLLSALAISQTSETVTHPANHTSPAIVSASN